MSFQPEGIDKIENLHGKVDFACENCPKTYKRKTAYEKHIITKSCKKKKIAIVDVTNFCCLMHSKVLSNLILSQYIR